MTDPLVWVPMERGTMPAATAAADPLEEPPVRASHVNGAAAVDAVERRGEQLAADLDDMLLGAPTPALKAGNPQL